MRNTYESPPCLPAMPAKRCCTFFSPDKKFSTWRKSLDRPGPGRDGVGSHQRGRYPTITQDMIDEMEAHVTDIDYEMAAQEEKKLRHDVMAHVHTFGHQCPKAAGIIHLGATSCYVGDNTDIIQMKEGLVLVRNKLVQVLGCAGGKFAKRYKALPTLGYTHFQAAQMVTVGKRATLWMNELLMDLEEVEFRIDNLKLLGSKGTTGTQASFMELFDGDTDKIKALEQKIATEMGFTAVVPVSGQTYSPQGGCCGAFHTLRYRPIRLQICHRCAAAVPHEGN